jgi:single-strand DNA-binding protein
MGINVFTASGRLGNDIDIRFTQNNKCIGSFSLPVESGWGDNKKTAWVTCKMFGERAQKLSQYLTKGSQVTVTGNFQMDEWEKDGVKHSRPVVIVNELQLPPQQPAQQGGWGQPQQPAKSAQTQQAPQQSVPQYNEPPLDFDDDIPF